MTTDIARIIDVPRIDLKLLARVNRSIEKPIPENGNSERGIGLGKKIMN